MKTKSGWLGGARLVAMLQFDQERLERVDFRADRRVDAVPGHGLGQRAFADFRGVDHRGIGDVRQYALMLGTLPGDAVELGQGQLQLAVVERLNGLHGAFAEGLAAEDQRAVVVLHGAGEDFRRRSGQAVDQHGHRPGVVGAGVFVGEHIDSPVAVAHQHGRTLLDEQAGQFGGFLQRTAAVVAQVDDDAVDLFLAAAR